MKQVLEQKTKEIVEVVADFNFNNLSLFSGDTGTLFLLSYYSEYTKDEKYLEKVEEIITDIYTNIQEGRYPINFSFSNGVTGFLWAINNLKSSGHIDIDIKEYFEGIIPLVYDYIFEKIEKGDYDFLHGALGPATFLMDTYDIFPENINVLKQFNVFLLDQGVCNHKKDTMYYISKVLKNENDSLEVINLSLSHGMASIIDYMTRCLKISDLADPTIEKALRRIINFYKINQNTVKPQKSYFPSWINLQGSDQSNSRLAWCYGDLGIGLVIYKAGKLFGDSDLMDYALSILKHTLDRKDPKIENIFEGNFCHGSSGLVEIYRSIYQVTNDSDFLEAANYWLQVTLDLAVYKDGNAGYKRFYGMEKEYRNDCTLLEGVSGIGVVFLETLLEKPLGWKSALMLNN